MLPELWTETIQYLSGRDAIDACEAIHHKDDDYLWNLMLERDYPDIDYDIFGDRPYEQYQMLVQVSRYVPLYESSILGVDLGIDMIEHARLEGELRDILHDTLGSENDIRDMLQPFTEQEIERMQAIYDDLYDMYWDVVHDEGMEDLHDEDRFYYGGEINRYINRMIAEGMDVVINSRDGLGYTRNDFRTGGVDEGSMNRHPSMSLDAIIRD